MYQNNPFAQWWISFQSIRDSIYEVLERREEFDMVSSCHDVVTLYESLPFKDDLKRDEDIGKELLDTVENLSDYAFDAVIKYYEEGTEENAEEVCQQFIKDMEEIRVKMVERGRKQKEKQKEGIWHV